MGPTVETILSAVAIISVVIITATVCYVMDRRGERVAELENQLAELTADRDYWKAEFEDGLPFGDSGWMDMLDDDSDASIDLLGVDLDSPAKHRTLWMYSEGEMQGHYVGRTESPDLATAIGHSVIGELDPLMVGEVGEVGEQAVRFEARYMTAEEIQAIPVV